MKKTAKLLTLLVCICVFSTIAVKANNTQREVYPGTPAITYESVTGDKMIDTYKVGDNVYFVYPYIDSDDKYGTERYYMNYLQELEHKEGWKRISHDETFGEYMYTLDGYVLKINIDEISERVTLTIYKDSTYLYETENEETIDNSIVTVYINGAKLRLDVAPRLINGRTMVPMRTIFEALETQVEWDNATQTITAEKIVSGEKSVNIEMQVGRNYMIVNGKKVKLDVAPVLINGRTLVPVRAISEALEINVEWHNEISTVDIYESAADKAILYNKNNEAGSYPVHLLKKYEYAGWSTKPYVTMYTEDGRTGVFKESEVAAQETVGWYKEPVQRLYAPGKSSVFKKSEVDAQLAVGWYTYPVQKVYAADGRTKVISESEVEAYVKVGWYRSKLEAVASNYPDHNVKVYSVHFYKNSVGGIEPKIEVINDSGKTVKYIYITAVPYNAVGDIVSSSIGGTTYSTLSITGPLESGSIWTFRWDPVWYNYTVYDIKITKIEVKYMDGTSETITNPPIWETIFRNAGI